VKLKPFMSKIMERKTHAYHDNVKTVWTNASFKYFSDS
jgi:hypothetical protein